MSSKVIHGKRLDGMTQFRRAALISVSSALTRHQLTLPDHLASASRGVPVYVPAFAGTTAPTHGGMARLGCPGWLVTYQDGLPDCIRSPIQVLTGPSVDELRCCDRRRYQLSQSAIVICVRVFVRG